MGLDDLYFGYINLMEFTYFLFVRTRSSLKYYPKMVTIMNIAFLIYINSYDYAACMDFLRFVIFFNMTIFM